MFKKHCVLGLMEIKKNSDLFKLEALKKVAE